jgi:hypothetical protein
LSAEAQRLLDSVPDIIGAQPGDAEQFADMHVAVIVPPAMVTPEILASSLKIAFGYVARLRQRECWKLTDAEATELSVPWAPILENALPGFVKEFSISNPGLVAAIWAAANVLGPKISQDMEESARPKRMDAKDAAGQSPAPAAPRSAALREEGNGVVWAS